MYRCNDCTTTFTIIGANGECALCGGQQVQPVSEEEIQQGLGFGFTIFGCDSCGGDLFEVDAGELRCRQCGQERDVSEDPRVVARAEAYAEDIKLMREKLRHIEERNFLAIGDNRIDLPEYFSNFARPSIEKISNWPDVLVELMSAGRWDEPANDETSQAWSSAKKLVDEVVAEVNRYKFNPPPITFLTYHRGIARTALEFGKATVEFLSALLSPSRREAFEVRDASQEMLDRASTPLGLASDLRDAVLPWIDGEDQTLDNAESRYGPTLRKDLFPELRVIAKFDPESAAPFWPSSVLSACLHDPDRRIKRNAAVRSLLDEATATNLAWSGPTPLLYSTITRNWKRLLDEQVRLSAAVRSLQFEQSRRAAIRDVLTSAANLAEGPFRHLGALVCVASKLRSDSATTLDAENLNRARALSDVIDVFKNRAPIVVEGLDVLLRNGSAHNVVEISDDLVAVERVENMRTRVANFKHADVVDYASNLHEVSVALGSALVTWILTSQVRPDTNKFREEWVEIAC